MPGDSFGSTPASPPHPSIRNTRPPRWCFEDVPSDINRRTASTGRPKRGSRRSAKPVSTEVWTASALQNYRMMRLLARLAQRFNDAGVPVMILKGAPLNLLMYITPDSRPMGDLDIMVRPEDAGRAFEILECLGAMPGGPMVRADFFPRFHYECEYTIGAIHPVKIDLHVRPFRPLRYAGLVPENAFWQNAQTVAIGDATVLVPCREEMLIHLCVHAAVHNCSRPIWLQDIRRWIHHGSTTLDWNHIVETVRRWRVALPFRTALERAFTDVESTVPQEVRNHLVAMHVGWRDRWVLRQAPRDAAHPVAHILTNVLCTPDPRFVLAYVRAIVLPSREHMADWYARRHLGWLCVAHLLRTLSPVLRRSQILWRWLFPIETKGHPVRGIGVYARRCFRSGSKIMTCHAHHGETTDSSRAGTSLRSNTFRCHELIGKPQHLKHSCQPNAVLRGLDLMALRTIEPGQEITIDHGPGSCRCPDRQSSAAVKHARYDALSLKA